MGKRKVLNYQTREKLKEIGYELKELGYEKEGESLIVIAHWQRYLEPIYKNRCLTLKGYKLWRKKNPDRSY